MLLCYLLCFSQPARAQNEDMPASPDFIDLEEDSLEEIDAWESVPQSQLNVGNLSIQQIVEPPVDYHYSAFGRPSPFQPPLEAYVTRLNPDAVGQAPEAESIVKGPDGAEIPVVSPLQRYPLTSLKVKGIWLLKGGEKKALIMTPKREGVIVKVGDPIAAGKVLEIFKGNLIVRQYRISRDGSREYQDHDLYLGDPPSDIAAFVRLAPGKDPEFSSPVILEEAENDESGEDSGVKKTEQSQMKPSKSGEEKAVPASDARESRPKETDDIAALVDIRPDEPSSASLEPRTEKVGTTSIQAQSKENPAAQPVKE